MAQVWLAAILAAPRRRCQKSQRHVPGCGVRGSVNGRTRRGTTCCNSTISALPGGNTNAASIMVGEKASDLILAGWSRALAPGSAKYGESRKVRLHGGVVAGAVRIPAPGGFDEHRANLYCVGSLRG